MSQRYLLTMGLIHKPPLARRHRSRVYSNCSVLSTTSAGTSRPPLAPGSCLGVARRPVPELSRALFGKPFGDKGYISKALFEKLFERGVELITGARRNKKGELICLSDRLLLRKRFPIETINDRLKNSSQIEHSRHRSARSDSSGLDFSVSLAGLIAYSHQPPLCQGSCPAL